MTTESKGRFAAFSRSQFMDRNQYQIQRLIQLSQKIRNPELTELATKIRQDYFSEEQKTFFDDSGFGPIIKLINDLITQLEEEQAAETSQHEWCNTEKETGVSAQQEREENLKGLKATVEADTTEIAMLKSEIVFLQ